jgi:small subunit ribosomal protein S13
LQGKRTPQATPRLSGIIFLFFYPNHLFMRIVGITIPEDKRLEIGLTALFGIGRTRAQEVLSKVKVDPALRPKDLSVDQENAIRKEIEAFQIEGDLKRAVAGNVKRLKDIKAYRGLRHMRSLPVRGQRTKSNSRTRRGNVRNTAGTGRKAADKK